MNYKRNIFICIGVLTTIAAFIFVLIFLYSFVTTFFRPTNSAYTNSSFASGEYVPEDKVYDEINRILSNYSMAGNISILKNKYNAYTTFEYENENGMVIYISTASSIWSNMNDYKEIKALMDVWLFLTEHEFSYDIVGISYWFKEGGKFTSSLFIPLSKTEFMDLNKSLKSDNISRMEKINHISELWIEKVGYDRKPGVTYRFSKYYN